MGNLFTYFLVLERSRVVEGAYQRVGIGNFEAKINENNVGGEVPEEETSIFREARVERIRIV